MLIVAHSAAEKLPPAYFFSKGWWNFWSSWFCTLLLMLVKHDCFPLNTSLVLSAILLPFNQEVQNKVEIKFLPNSSLHCQARYPRWTSFPSASQTDLKLEPYRFAGISSDREGKCRVAGELAKNGHYSLTWKIFPGKTAKTESSYSLVFWEWWGKQWIFFIIIVLSLSECIHRSQNKQAFLFPVF